MTSFALLLVMGCFAFVAFVPNILSVFKKEIAEEFSLILIIMVSFLGSFGAYYVISGSIAPQWKLSNTVYTVVGTPTRSTTEKDKFIAILQSPGEKEHVYLVESIPPPGFKTIKTAEGQEFYVPEKFLPNQ